MAAITAASPEESAEENTDVTMPVAATSFIRFPKLPIELRMMIWELCLPQTRQVLGLDTFSHTRNILPAMAYVCSESSAVALRDCTVLSFPHVSTPTKRIWFNSRLDILTFPGWNCDWFTWVTQCPPTIRYISCDVWGPTSSRLVMEIAKGSTFPKLEEFTVVLPGGLFMSHYHHSHSLRNDPTGYEEYVRDHISTNFPVVNPLKYDSKMKQWEAVVLVHLHEDQDWDALASGDYLHHRLCRSKNCLAHEREMMNRLWERKGRHTVEAKFERAFASIYESLTNTPDQHMPKWEDWKQEQRKLLPKIKPANKCRLVIEDMEAHAQLSQGSPFLLPDEESSECASDSEEEW
ncbi:putative 2EXR domain-containing protein [Seiridium cardinale]|uniref:2EXR domain-containing protein n=1 Tax=Seiridium cardinale TaxID=138064 RepID=A0ABR2XYQ4_9PEZI